MPDGLSRHAEDYATLFILSESVSANLFQCEQSLDAIGTHAGEYGRGGIGAGGLGDGMKQHVDGRTLEANHGAVLNFDAIACEGAPEQHVEVTGSDQRQTGFELIAFFGLANSEGTEFIQTIREGAGKDCGDVLGDDHTRTVLREFGQNFVDGLGSAGGGANCDDSRGWEW